MSTQYMCFNPMEESHGAKPPHRGSPETFKDFCHRAAVDLTISKGRLPDAACKQLLLSPTVLTPPQE